MDYVFHGLQDWWWGSSYSFVWYIFGLVYWAFAHAILVPMTTLSLCGSPGRWINFHAYLDPFIPNTFYKFLPYLFILSSPSPYSSSHFPLLSTALFLLLGFILFKCNCPKIISWIWRFTFYPPNIKAPILHVVRSAVIRFSSLLSGLYFVGTTWNHVKRRI